MTLALTVCLTMGSSLAADLVIDGAPYTVDSDVNFNNVYIGNVSTGTLNQTGGTNTENNNLYLGYSSGSRGTYNLSGGSLSTISAVIGNGGNGTFTQTVGTSVHSGNLYLGYSSDGTYRYPVLFT